MRSLCASRRPHQAMPLAARSAPTHPVRLLNPILTPRFLSLPRRRLTRPGVAPGAPRHRGTVSAEPSARAPQNLRQVRVPPRCIVFDPHGAALAYVPPPQVSGSHHWHRPGNHLQVRPPAAGSPSLVNHNHDVAASPWPRATAPTRSCLKTLRVSAPPHRYAHRTPP